MKKILFGLLSFVASFCAAQLGDLGPSSKISLLTIGNADELHSRFGHTALRIQNPSDSLDIVFGYGGFDFNDPNFYYKFTTGKLDYSMTGHHFDSFVEEYKIENRSIHEQELNLSTGQKKVLFRYLKNNYRPENRKYKYDFLFDNCATKIPEVLQETFGNTINFDETYLSKESTFRQLIHESLDTNSWTSFGIDLALGSIIDREATAYEHQFLPKYVSQQFENATLNKKPLVKAKTLILAKQVQESSGFKIWSPAVILSLLLILVAIVTYCDIIRQKRTKSIDFLLFFSTGVAGLIICFLWFMTDHSSTKMNFNLFWAFAPNLIVAFFLLKNKTPHWLTKYIFLALFLMLLLIILWVTQFQIFSPLLILVIITLLIRYLFLLKHIKIQNLNSKK